MDSNLGRGARVAKGDGWKLDDGDMLQSIDGREPNSRSHATRIIGSYQPGEKLQLKVLRQRKALTLDIELPQEQAGRAKSGDFP